MTPGSSNHLPVVEKLFDLLARARSAPAFHPRGRLFEGALRIEGDGPLPAGEHPVVARLSKGAGLPGPLPDFLGIAVRVQPAQGTPIDFLCTTTWPGRVVGLWLLTPARQWAGATLSTLMPWEAGAERRQVLLRVAERPRSTASTEDLARHLPVDIDVRVVDGDVRPVQRGILVLDRTSARSSDDLAFDPLLHHPAGWELGPRWLARLREAAYAGSREGRDAHDPRTPD